MKDMLPRMPLDAAWSLISFERRDKPFVRLESRLSAPMAESVKDGCLTVGDVVRASYS